MGFLIIGRVYSINCPSVCHAREQIFSALPPFSLHLTCLSCTQTMQAVNKKMDPQKTLKTMQDFQKENMKMGMTEDMSKDSQYTPAHAKN